MAVKRTINEITTTATSIADTDNFGKQTSSDVTEKVAWSLMKSELILSRGSFYGFRIKNNVTDADHDIDISLGECSDITGVLNIKTTGTFVKRIDANWAEGTGNGGFPSGLALAASTAYYVFAIVKSDDSVDFGFDTSLTAANLLTDASAYTSYRRIGSIRTDSSENILAMYEIPGLGGGKHVYYADAISDLNIENPTTGSEQTLATSVPPGISVIGMYTVFNREIAGTGGVLEVLVRGGGQTVDIETGGGYHTTIAPLKNISTINLPVTNGNIYWYGTVISGSITTDNKISIKTFGWYDPLTNELF